LALFDRSDDIADLRGQARVIAEVCPPGGHPGAASRWASAAAPYPIEAPRYQPVSDREQPLSDTNHAPAPALVPARAAPAARRTPLQVLAAQRRLVETFIYLYEVRGIRRTQDLYALAEVTSLGEQRDPWAKLGGQLATGSGKTKMSEPDHRVAYLNAVLEGEAGLAWPARDLDRADLFVKDRLLQDFAPPWARHRCSSQIQWCRRLSSAIST